MKKLLATATFAVFLVLLMGGCSIEDLKDRYFPQAQGVLLYGDKEVLEEDIEAQQNHLVDHEVYAVKIEEVDEEKIMIMKEDAAQKLLNKGLFREVLKGDKVGRIDQLAEVIEDRPLLFSKKEQKNIKLGETIYDVNDGGNVVIGDGRTYVDSFLIVHDSFFNFVKGEEKAIGLLHFIEEENPKDKLLDFEAERVQLTSIDN